MKNILTVSVSCLVLLTFTTLPAISTVASFELTFQTDGNGSLSGPVDQTVAAGESSEAVVALGDASHQFSHWTDSGGAVVSTSSGLVISDVQNNETYTAHFEPRQYSMRIVSATGGGTDKKGNQTAEHGSRFVITAGADAEYHFVGWNLQKAGFGITAAAPVTHEENPLVIDPVTAAYQITPIFERSTGSLQINFSPEVAGASWQILPDEDHRKSGSIATGLPTGTYTVGITVPEGFSPVSAFDVEIFWGDLTRQTIDLVEVEADQPEVNSILLILNADDSAAPQWRLGGGSDSATLGAANQKWRASGERATGLTPGTYSIEFSAIPGYLKPGITTITLEPGGTVELVINYPRPVFSAAQDYDGDGLIDLPTRFANGKRLMVASNLGYSGEYSDLIVNTALGVATDVYAPGDYDGDGVADPAYYRPGNGTWHVPGILRVATFGSADAIPVPGDYDGDGADDPALYDAVAGTWTIYFWSTGETVTLSIGGEREIPVPANWDGDANGTIEPATWNVNNYKWNVYTYRKAPDTWRRYGKQSLFFGESGDYPVPADYDGDGKADHVVYRSSTNQFIANDTSALKTVTLGQAGDHPMAADWLGTGEAIPTIFRPGTGEWITPDDVFEFVFGEGWSPVVSTIIE